MSDERVVIRTGERDAQGVGDSLTHAATTRLESGGVVPVDGTGAWRDRVRWSPIVAGLLSAVTSLLLLSLLGAAVGLSTVNAGTAAAQGGPPPGLGTSSAIWGAVSGVLSFLLGGYVAGRTSGNFDRGWAWRALLPTLAVAMAVGSGCGSSSANTSTAGQPAAAQQSAPMQRPGGAATRPALWRLGQRRCGNR